KSLGPLIHNPQVVAELAKRGISVVNNASEVQSGTVIIRSHGVCPDERETLEKANLEIVDATCPYVLRAQKAGAQLSRQHGAVAVVGDPDHPEVEAICAYARQAGGNVWTIDSADRIPKDLPRKIGVVVQTTQNREVFEAILVRLAEHGIEVDVKDTICEATAKRQSAARELAASVDAMVVIGGHNSSNTTRLYEICKGICPHTYHIESLEELDPTAFDGCTIVGITAGASTPENQIVAVESYLERL
ncbi:MAG: 4-hydroxy-3-methylbut-2-enyl diphosphate reductase, partial [Coriobacteriia bacterium]|nr:4-hydroxy-3-methylbut-2-enyl diphosphate reductase [Coriobacteriia bacterium]